MWVMAAHMVQVLLAASGPEAGGPAAQFDFYAMDCYRLIGDDKLTETHAREIISKTTTPDRTALSPMHNSGPKSRWALSPSETATVRLQ